MNLPTRSRAAKSSDRQAGFQLLEVVAASSLVLLGIAAALHALTPLSSQTLGQQALIVVAEGARGQLERMRGVSFQEVFARFNADPADDPDGYGTAPGESFGVPGLDAVADDADGMVGEIQFPLGGLSGMELREDISQPELGLPRDLNGDGIVDSVDHSGDYRILPVTVRLLWSDRGRDQAFELRTYLVDGGGI